MFFGKQGLLPGLVVLWSLAVEEHFYIIYALAFYLMISKSTLNRLGAGLIILCVVILFWRAYIAMGLVEGLNLTREFLHTSTASDTRVDSMIFGCIMAVFLNPLDSKKPNISKVNMYLLLTCSCIGILLTLLYRDYFFRETIRYTIQGISLIPVFYFSITCSNNILFKWLSFKWIEYFGRISYTFYLSHFVCIYLAPKILPTFGVIENYVFAFFLSIAFSSLMYFTIETYFNKKRKQLSF